MSLLAELTKDLPRGDPGIALMALAERVTQKIIKKWWFDRPGTEDDYHQISRYFELFLGKYFPTIDIKYLSNLHFTSNYARLRSFNSVVIRNRALLLHNAVESHVSSVFDDYEVPPIGESFGLARLDGDEKKKIHGHIQRIRTIIEESTISDRKKNALFAKLKELIAEVDAAGTRTDRFFSFVADLGFVMGEFGKNARPLFDEARGMIKALSRARARQEGISLPPGEEPLMLPNPANEE